MTTQETYSIKTISLAIATDAMTQFGQHKPMTQTWYNKIVNAVTWTDAHEPRNEPVKEIVYNAAEKLHIYITTIMKDSNLVDDKTTLYILIRRLLSSFEFMKTMNHRETQITDSFINRINEACKLIENSHPVMN